MRIVGGKFAGRDLTSPGNSRVRPTSEHVRAALLDHLRDDLAEARILDLFAGTGALGLEALSRGSRSADFVEMNTSSLHALKANVARFKLTKQTRVFVKDAIHFADALPPDRYDICFADPPYESKQLDWLIRIWHARRFARVLVVEHAHTHELPRGAALLTFETTRVTIYRRAADVPADDEAGAPAIETADTKTAASTPATRDRATDRRPASPNDQGPASRRTGGRPGRSGPSTRGRKGRPPA